MYIGNQVVEHCSECFFIVEHSINSFTCFQRVWKDTVPKEIPLSCPFNDLQVQVAFNKQHK